MQSRQGAQLLIVGPLLTPQIVNGKSNSETKQIHKRGVVSIGPNANSHGYHRHSNYGQGHHEGRSGSRA